MEKMILILGMSFLALPAICEEDNSWAIRYSLASAKHSGDIFPGSDSSLSQGLELSYKVFTKFSVDLGYVDFGEAHPVDSTVFETSGFSQRELSSDVYSTAASSNVSITYYDSIFTPSLSWSARMGIMSLEQETRRYASAISRMGSNDPRPIEASASSKTEKEGVGYFFGLGGHYELNSSWSAGLTLEYYKATLDGERIATPYYYVDVRDSDIDGTRLIPDRYTGGDTGDQAQEGSNNIVNQTIKLPDVDYKLIRFGASIAYSF